MFKKIIIIFLSIFFVSCFTNPYVTPNTSGLYTLPENVGSITLDGGYNITIYAVQTGIKVYKGSGDNVSVIADDYFITTVNYEINNTTNDKINSLSKDELKDIAIKASPVKIAEIAEEADAYVSEIEESAEILGGDLEIDLGIDVSDELNQLETEMLLDQGGAMPAVPEADLEYISEEELPVEDAATLSKDKVQEEIEKLKKELNT